MFDDTNFRYSVYNNEEGVMGLAPTASPGSELFMEVLKKRGIIDVLAFNIDYRYFGSKYSMTFGGIDTERVPSLDNFTFTDLYEENSWTVEITSMRYDNKEFGGQATKGFFNTHDQYLRLPPEDYKRWSNIIASRKSCEKSGVDYRCICKDRFEESLPSFHITFENHTYYMMPQKFIWERFNQTENRNYCIFQVRESEDPSTVTLGLAFLKNANVYYDMEKKRIGIYQGSTISSRFGSGGGSGS